MKKCNRCDKTKPVEAFYARPDRPGGLRSYCKACGRAMDREAYHRNPAIKARSSRRLDLRRYGLTEQGYEALLWGQGGVCGICGTPPTNKRLCVDHDHSTGQLRGLLCGPCNQAIGLLGDSAEGVNRALSYLLASGPASILDPLSGSE